MNPRTLRKEVFLPHPPEDVWLALTAPQALAEWLMPNNFEPVVGRKFRFHVDPMPGHDMKAISKDGTVISYDRLGQGPPVILVDGALCSRAFGPMPKLAALMAKHFTRFTY